MSAFGGKADIRPSTRLRSRHGADVETSHLPPMPESLLASVDETVQRCLIVCPGAAVAGAVACLDILPARLATLIGVRGRRAAQNASTASVTAALISA